MNMTIGKLLALVKNVGGQGAGGGGGVQPDWNQYLPDAPEYIKNRTHGLELAREVEQAFTMRSVASTTANMDMRAQTGTYDLKIGETYAIVVDGVTYFSECREVPVEPVTGSDYLNGTEAVRKAIGDKTFATCPFYMYIRGDATGVYKAERHVFADTGAHNAKVYTTYMTPKLKTLDEKYIPDTIARKSDLESLGGGGGGMKTLIIKNIYKDGTDTYIASNMTFDEAKEMYMNCEPFLCYDVEVSLEEDGSMNHFNISLANDVQYYKGNEYWDEHFQINTNGPVYSFYADGSVTAYID